MTTLEPALRQLRGLLHYYVAVDEQESTMINVSVWTGLAEAKQMDRSRRCSRSGRCSRNLASASIRSATIRPYGPSRLMLPPNKRKRQMPELVRKA